MINYFVDHFTLISLWNNNIGAKGTAAIKRALNLTIIWNRRKNLLIFNSFFSRSHSPNEGNNYYCYLNVMKVMEMEEMKREISNFLWWVNEFFRTILNSSIWERKREVSSQRGRVFFVYLWAEIIIIWIINHIFGSTHKTHVIDCEGFLGFFKREEEENAKWERITKQIIR